MYDFYFRTRHVCREFNGKLQDVEDLLFYLLKDVFHFDDDDLHLGLIGFGAEGVDFTSHLLGDEAEFLSDTGGDW